MDVPMEDGGILRSVEYRRAVKPEERLIADWGQLKYKAVAANFLRAVYASKP
jgi:hypothetical protein